ncbi:MAG: Ig-like domain-containing protein, partial [Candidatus Falkowbacteria bacterium]|nr:Ig-like domain-containing protein [Candidatus Falkowbacteria bacterium]
PTCECCCRVPDPVKGVANSDQDCCGGLTCTPGLCNLNTPTYGLCTGCLVTGTNGAANQAASDAMCNCSKTSHKVCNLNNIDHPEGVCVDEGSPMCSSVDHPNIKKPGEQCLLIISASTITAANQANSCSVAACTCSQGTSCLPNTDSSNPECRCCCEAGDTFKSLTCDIKKDCQDKNGGNDGETGRTTSDATRGLFCGCINDNQCGAITTTGCSNQAERCCLARPIITTTTPDNLAINVCRNAAINADFNMRMNASSFEKNIVLLINNGLAPCQAGTFYYQEGGAYWCAVPAIPTIYNHDDGTSISTVDLHPANILQANSTYRVIIKGDHNINEGVLSVTGLSMHGKDDGDYIWTFKTAITNDLCEIGSVALKPTNWLFQTITNNPADDDTDSNDAYNGSDSVRDSDKSFVAQAISQNSQQIISYPGVYEWYWNWHSDNTSVANFRANAYHALRSSGSRCSWQDQKYG